MNGNIYSDIFKCVRTTDELSDLENAINAATSALYKNDAFDEQTIQKTFGPLLAKGIIAALAKAEVQLSDREGVKKFLTDLETYCSSVEVMHATIAMAVDEGVLTVFREWFETSFAERTVVVELTRDPSLIGGVQLSYAGRYWDYSLEKQIAKVFQEKKDAVFTMQSPPGKTN